jgi:hypothetical protein
VPLLADARVPDAAHERVARLEDRDPLAALRDRDHVAGRVPQRLELRVGAALDLAADQILRPAPLVDAGGEVLPERERRPDRAGPLDPPGPGERASAPADTRGGARHVEREQDRVLLEVPDGVRRVLDNALADRLRVLARALRGDVGVAGDDIAAEAREHGAGDERAGRDRADVLERVPDEMPGRVRDLEARCGTARGAAR